MRAEIITGCSGVGLAAVSYALPVVFPHVDPWVAKVILGLGLLLIFAAFVLWLSGTKSKPTGDGVTQTSHGPNSHQIGSVGWDAHIYVGAAPTSPPPPSRYRTWDDPPQSSRPEFPIWRAVEHVAKTIGDDNDCFPRVRQQLRQAASEGRIEVWGRKEIRPTHLKDERQSSVWTPINRDYWRDYELNSLATGELFSDREHTSREGSINEVGNRYWELLVHESDTKREWPESRDDGHNA